LHSDAGARLESVENTWHGQFPVGLQIALAKATYERLAGS